MRFLVLGCNGMLGHVVGLYLSQQNHEVLGVARKDLGFEFSTQVQDLEEKDNLAGLIGSERFDAIINCAGVLNKDASNNKSSAVYINSYLPHFLSGLVWNTQTHLIHVSTDCVFSGRSGSYLESSFRDSEDFYGRSKALGELENEKDLTIRTSLVGPDVHIHGIGLFNWFMKQNGAIKGYQKAIWTGLTSIQMAKVILFSSEERLHGLYNVVPDFSISKYELLKLFNTHCRRNTVEITPDLSFEQDKSLKACKEDYKGLIPDYDTMVVEMAEWIKLHPKIYPHYAGK